MNLKQAKEILESLNLNLKNGNSYSALIREALDIAIQCLEDSVGNKLEKCGGCNEMVEMVIIDKICPKCNG